MLERELELELELDRALERKVWLKSGGSIVIDQTEALVAIDVNTGRFVGQDNLDPSFSASQNVFLGGSDGGQNVPEVVPLGVYSIAHRI